MNFQNSSHECSHHNPTVFFVETNGYPTKKDDIPRYFGKKRQHREKYNYVYYMYIKINSSNTDLGACHAVVCQAKFRPDHELHAVCICTYNILLLHEITKRVGVFPTQSCRYDCIHLRVDKSKATILILSSLFSLHLSYYHISTSSHSLSF